jgi:hypothetical protein
MELKGLAEIFRTRLNSSQVILGRGGGGSQMSCPPGYGLGLKTAYLFIFSFSENLQRCLKSGNRAFATAAATAKSVSTIFC